MAILKPERFVGHVIKEPHPDTSEVLSVSSFLDLVFLKTAFTFHVVLWFGNAPHMQTYLISWKQASKTIFIREADKSVWTKMYINLNRVCVCVYNKCKVYQRLPVQEPKIGSRVIRKSWPLLEGHQHAVKKTNTHPVGSLMAAKVSHMSHKGQWMSKIKNKTKWYRGRLEPNPSGTPKQHNTHVGR